MGHEIERKFLVKADKLPPLIGGTRFLQGYLSERPTVRFRVYDGLVVLCVKKRISRGHRIEFEFERGDMTEEEIGDLCSTALWPPLAKTRFCVEHAGLTWEIDVYEGENAGLVTADVELPDHDYPIEFPEWIDSEAEITGKKRYANIRLTRYPLSKRKKQKKPS